MQYRLGEETVTQNQLSSKRMLLEPAIERAAAACESGRRRTGLHLPRRSIAAGDVAIPYSTITAVDATAAARP